MSSFVLYTRVSTQEQGDSRLGLEAQLDAMQRFASMGGHTVIAHLEEVISGKHGLDRRPKLKQAFDLA